MEDLSREGGADATRFARVPQKKRKGRCPAPPINGGPFRQGRRGRDPFCACSSKEAQRALSRAANKWRTFPARAARTRPVFRVFLKSLSPNASSKSRGDSRAEAAQRSRRVHWNAVFPRRPATEL